MTISGNNQESITLTNQGAGTNTFSLRGGLYGVTAHGTWGGGNANLKRLAADGTTYVVCLTQITADIYTTVSLPPGSYEVVIVTATAVYIDITLIPTAVLLP